MTEKPLYARVTTAFVWIAAFCLAAGVFLSIALLFRSLPPTDPIAIGRVSIERYSKLRDYLGAALFFLLVPPLTIGLQRLLARGARAQRSFSASIAFLLPYLLAPLFYLTTGKVGWILLLPIALSFAAPRALAFAKTRRWFREMFRRELGAFHALLFGEAVAWLLFRYIVTGRRIAHIPTLFLELVFVAGFLAIFWAAALLIARMSELAFGRPAEDVFRRIVIAALPIVLLPFLAAAFVPMPHPRMVMAATLVVVAAIAFVVRRPLAPKTAWRLAAFLILPALIYLFSYASTAQLVQSIDLFHRGETLGPASDYLRGKVPFRDVFALHGMLEDGLLDSWLMQMFGRSLDVAVTRTVVLGAFFAVALWFLGLTLFDSIPLSLVCVAMASWTTAENNRTVFQVVAVALFWNALRRRSRVSAVLSGALAGFALFFSLDVGIYSIVGGLAAALLVWVASLRVEWDGLAPWQAAAWFLLGVILGAAPFVVYLAMHDALGAFALTSFVTIPRIIDAIWSLPFPDLVSTFRADLNLHTLAEFVLFEKFHLIVSPLAIVVAGIYFIQRWLRRRADRFDFGLLVLAVFAAVVQRTAFGRAEIRHQVFAAYLIGPTLVLLAVILVRTLCGVWRGGGEGTRAFVVTLAAVSLPVVGVLFWIPDLVNARLEDFVRYPYRVAKVEKNPDAHETRVRIDEVSKGIHELTKAGEPIFDFSNQPAFYFFADRPNPTRFYQVPIASPRAFQAETIRALERAKPKVVLRHSPDGFDQFDGVTNELRAQAVAAYLDDTYHFHRSIRGVELWSRRTDASVRPLASYLDRIRLPDVKELVSSGVARMVFPAVGSLPGIGDSYWQSDLTMHNPFRDPIPVTLRFVTNDGGMDRRFTLAPRQTMRWPDVVRQLFGGRHARGALWIEHRQGRAPVAVVKTSDVAHGARASFEEPLTLRDAATASTDAAELTLVGIAARGTEWRRVNAGVVNIGIIPAVVRISAWTRSGRRVGQLVESGIAEDQVWLINDLENALGVPLDETMTVRMTVAMGTAAGYATVVGEAGDSEFLAAIPAQSQ